MTGFGLWRLPWKQTTGSTACGGQRAAAEKLNWPPRPDDPRPFVVVPDVWLELWEVVLRGFPRGGTQARVPNVTMSGGPFPDKAGKVEYVNTGAGEAHRTTPPYYHLPSR